MSKKKTFTKVLIAIFSIIALLAAFLPVMDSAAAFSDVSYDHPNLNAVNYLEDNEVVDGYDDGTYKPDDNINRAEFLKIVMGATEYEEEGEDCFEDVSDEWFAPYICKAAELKFVEGYDDGTFRPEQEINFAEASKMVANLLGLELDLDLDDNWFQQFVVSLEGLNAIPASVEDFGKTMTRAEMSDMIYKIDSENFYGLSNTYEGVMSGETVVAELTAFDDCEELKGFLGVNMDSYNVSMRGMWEDDIMFAEPAAMEMDMAEESVSTAGAEGGAEGGAEFSTTNIQVEGVDEADIVKNDAEYVYTIKDSTVRIIKAYPPEEMAEVAVVTFGNEDFYPSEMYVDGDRLVVIGSAYEYLDYFVSEVDDRGYGDVYTDLVEVYVLDISDRSEPVVERQVDFEGYYSTSRKVDDVLYLITNKYSNYWSWVEEDWDDMPYEDVVPLYADSAVDDIQATCSCGDVMYVPGSSSSDYMVVSAIDISDSDSVVKSEAVLGSSLNVYSSRDNLYIAEQYYNPVFWDRWTSSWQDETIVHKVGLGYDDMEYLGSGTVSGRTLNQFSMDENNGYFRIATTEGQTWDDSSLNNLYVLDDDLEVVGSVEGLAPGEEIYSVRFLGDRAYMVTFKTIDPLFVIDVSDPTDPEVLGELKIPGFSDYLHPYDEDHLIGFGLDTDAMTEEEMDDMGVEGAWYQGVKLAMFDVSDVENPEEMHKVVIGDRGTHSELSWNHKALLFDKDKGIMAFPITIAEIPQDVKDFGVDSWSYGDYTFQGAYVYDVSLEDGFELRGTVTHYDNFDAEYNYGYDYTKWLERILYIGDYFYTTSSDMVKANQMDDLSDVAEVELD
ncbi:copper amine oxidase [Candidatus Peregrinibacteria bacterium]|jgi:inhibitor of cysteine peptidase|nr:copper amine oxidase [Candidatus Peregrinibacteria bacterium]MBT4147786.1 copper amine oxidase [Candidatus Peregrinibacteria bacterium]MBT4366321.1 copper amine oxidase [Candidatus Peregrinibacteria bacterium]MBT4456528.1 copper amine oxidase [Candidatus Peregrinibacteria bacterium]